MADDSYRIMAIELVDGIGDHSPEIGQETRIAIHDILERNLFRPHASPGGPYRLMLGTSESADHPVGQFHTFDRKARIYQSSAAPGELRLLPRLLGSLAVANRQYAAELIAEYPGRVAIGLDHRDGELQVRGWEERGDAQLLDAVKQGGRTALIENGGNEVCRDLFKV